MVAALLVLLGRAVCRVRGHVPIKVFDKFDLTGVSLVDAGWLGVEANVEASHVYCRRCRATQHTSLDGITAWVS